MCQSVLTRETDLMQNTQISKRVQDRLTVASRRVRCGRVRCPICTQETRGVPQTWSSALQSVQVGVRRLKRLRWKPGGDVQGEGEDSGSSEATEVSLPSSCPSHAIMVTVLPTGSSLPPRRMLSQFSWAFLTQADTINYHISYAIYFHTGC